MAQTSPDPKGHVSFFHHLASFVPLSVIFYIYIVIEDLLSRTCQTFHILVTLYTILPNVHILLISETKMIYRPIRMTTWYFFQSAFFPYIFVKIHCFQGVRYCVMVFYATFNNISDISWQSVLLMDETREYPE
jgi:hypothetical protein